MTRNEKIEFLKGVADGSVKPSLFKGVFYPTVEELVKIRACSDKERSEIPLTDEESKFVTEFNSRGKPTFDHLSYEELYFLRYKVYPDD